MLPELETLYTKSLERPDLARWLVDRKKIYEYKENLRRVELCGDQLLEMLTGKELELFQELTEREAEYSDADRRIFFCQGLSIGLRLGSLCAWV